MDDVKKEDMDSHDCYFNAMLNFAFCGEVRLVDDAPSCIVPGPAYTSLTSVVWSGKRGGTWPPVLQTFKHKYLNSHCGLTDPTLRTIPPVWNIHLYPGC